MPLRFILFRAEELLLGIIGATVCSPMAFMERGRRAATFDERSIMIEVVMRWARRSVDASKLGELCEE